jgi:hypothetical protein
MMPKSNCPYTQFMVQFTISVVLLESGVISQTFSPQTARSGFRKGPAVTPAFHRHQQ